MRRWTTSPTTSRWSPSTATRHLLSLGHRTVYHVAGPLSCLDAKERVDGWRQALREAGAPEPAVLAGDWSARSGYELGSRLAAGEPGPSAVFCGNDTMALGVIRAMSERGLRVPNDVSVIGFDDVPEAAYYIPPLTTVRPDFDAVAAASIDLLLAQITSGHRLGDRRVLTPTLITRESVAPPRS